MFLPILQHLAKSWVAQQFIAQSRRAFAKSPQGQQQKWGGGQAWHKNANKAQSHADVA